jgi:hypothetical protein
VKLAILPLNGRTRRGAYLVAGLALGAVDRLSAKAQEQLVEPDSSRQREGGSGARWPLAQLRPEEGGADAPARR